MRVSSIFLKEPSRELRITLAPESRVTIPFGEPMIISYIGFNHNNFIVYLK